LLLLYLCNRVIPVYLCIYMYPCWILDCLRDYFINRIQQNWIISHSVLSAVLGSTTRIRFSGRTTWRIHLGKAYICGRRLNSSLKRRCNVRMPLSMSYWDYPNVCLLPSPNKFWGGTDNGKEYRIITVGINK
jgi:hypothetical protein